MSHIPRENKMHPNIKILRLTSALKEKKKQPSWQHILKNILNLAGTGCATIYPEVISWSPVTYFPSPGISHGH